MINKQKKILTSLLCIFVFLLIYPLLTLGAAVPLEIKKYPILNGVDLNTIQNLTLPIYMKWLFDFGMFLGFFSVFIAFTLSGSFYLFSALYPNAVLQARAKDFFSGATTGLTILLSLYLVVTTINTDFAFFREGEAAQTPPPPQLVQPGISFFNSADCSGNDPLKFNGSIGDLGGLKHKVNSVAITNDPFNKIFYAGVLYDDLSYYGKCLYINPNLACQPVDSFGLSASVYQYNTNVNGDGVYFYRYSNFNPAGGYFKVSNDQIKTVYSHNLESLKFVDPALIGPDNPEGCTVPENERDKEKGCAKYNDDETCRVGVCPTLAGENIASVHVKGSYAVLLVAMRGQDPGINTNGPWSFCQAFPASGDPGHLGPIENKWQPARTNASALPNGVIIIPIE